MARLAFRGCKRAHCGCRPAVVLKTNGELSKDPRKSLIIGTSFSKTCLIFEVYMMHAIAAVGIGNDDVTLLYMEGGEI